ncbi:MAG: DUF7670 domain-containing protein [Candidatus Hydrogenedens sp.]
MRKFMYWTPRILSILFILFLMLFSLDVFSEELGFWQTLIGLIMHNMPAFVLIVVLIFAWKYEMVGGVAFILAGLLYISVILRNSLMEGFQWYYISWIVIISGPAFMVGILFLFSWLYKKVEKT